MINSLFSIPYISESYSYYDKTDLQPMQNCLIEEQTHKLIMVLSVMSDETFQKRWFFLKYEPNKYQLNVCFLTYLQWPSTYYFPCLNISVFQAQCVCTILFFSCSSLFLSKWSPGSSPSTAPSSVPIKASMPAFPVNWKIRDPLPLPCQRMHFFVWLLNNRQKESK